jgi:hypothetical protein
MTVTTEVELDLEDIDTYELVNELVSRIGRFKRRQMTEKQIESLRSDFYELAEKLNFTSDGFLPKTLDDKLKLEHLSNVWQKYSLSEIEQRLP